jgi:hypothetical protein
MHRFPPIRVVLALIAAGSGLTAALYGRAQKPAAPSRYYMECLSFRSVGNDINTQASQGWTVRGMVVHTGLDGQECLLVLFERGGQNQ